MVTVLATKKGKTAATIQKQLDHAMPAADDAKLGTLLVNLLQALNAVVAAMSAYLVTSGTLAIHGAGSPVVKTTTALLAYVNGVFVRKAPTDLPALAGANVATAHSVAYAFYIDGSGNLTVSGESVGTTHDLALAGIPTPPVNLAQIGIVVIDNATGANFVPGTTALDTGSLTVTYYNSVGAMQAVNAQAAVLGDLTTR